MAFALTLLYIALTLISPAVLPDAIINLHVMEILGGLVILSLVPSISASKVATTFDSYLAIGLLFSTALSTMATGWFGGVPGALGSFIPLLFVFYFVMIACRSLRRLKILIGVLLAVSIFILLQGAIADYTNNIASRYLLLEGPLLRYRGLGLVSDPNDLAQLFVMLIPLLWLRWKKGHFAGNFMFTILPAGVLAWGLYLTHSRGGTFALLAVMLYGFKDKLGLVKSSILAGLGAVAMLALNISGGRGMNEDDGGRVALWGQGLMAFRSHFFLGIGKGNFSDYSDSGLTAHNSYVLCLAELGIIGYFFWMGMIVSGWSGLSGIIGREKTETVEEDSMEVGNSRRSAREQVVLMKPVRSTFGAGQSAALARSNGASFSSFEGHKVGLQNSRGWSSSPGALYEDRPIEGLPEDEELAYAAKIIRIGLLGFLASAFFLSRTYSVPLYVVLGMAAAVRSIERTKHPEMTQDLPKLMKQIGIAIVASIFFLYAFVRLHGV